MKSTFAASLILLASILSSSIFAAANSSRNHVKAVVVDGRLRSAFLIRAFGGDWPVAPQSAQDASRTLQRHFDVVIEILKDNEQHSLSLSMERLEALGNSKWSANEAVEWRKILASRRKQNIAILQQYRDHGRFPLNEGHALQAVPIFIDQHDTACAVGHLMRESGWGDQAASIAKSQLLVYVSDVRHGPLVDWILQSGLTQEEAALIQPGYPPVVTHQQASLLNGGSMETGGIRLENFQWIPNAGNSGKTFGMSLFEGGHYPPNSPVYLDPELSHLAYVKFGNSTIPFQGGLTNSTGTNYARLKFEAVATLPNHRINGAGISNYVWINVANANPGGAYGIVGSFRDPLSQPLAYAFLIISDSATIGGSDFKNFSPQQRVAIDILMELDGSAYIESFNVELNLVQVPESNGFATMLIAVSFVGLTRCLRR